MTATPTRLALVVGCPRSGTTWLQRMLLCHPRTVGPAGESFLFVALRPWTARWSEPEGGWLPAPAARRDLTRRFCDRLLAAFVTSTGTAAAVLVEKTPAHVHDLDVVAQLYPDAYVIHVVRDGRDVARSLAELDFGATDVAAAARAWSGALASAERSRSRLENFREVRYEDVVADPVGVVSSILEWMRLEVTDDVRAALADTAAVRVSQYNTGGAVGPGKWTGLRAVDMAAIYAVAGRALVSHGYLTVDALRREQRRPRVMLGRGLLRARSVVRRRRATP